MSDWKECTLGDLIETGDATLQTGPFGTALKAAEYAEHGVPLISVREIREGYLQISEDTPKVSKETTARLPKFVLEKGDIVFGRKGGVDRNAIIRGIQSGWFLGSDGIRLRLSEKYDSRFFSMQMRSSFVRTWLLQHCEGTTMPSLNQKVLSRLPIVVPPLNEQSRIADILFDLDDKIELNRQINQTLEQIAQTVFKSWFVDFEPVNAKIAAKAAGRDPERAAMCAISGKLEAELDQLPPEQRQQLAATAALFPDELVESELGLIPLGWEWTTFGRVIELFDSKRIPLSNRERELRKGDIPYYGAAALMDYVDDYLFDGVHVLLAEDGSVMTPEDKPVTQYVWGRFWVNNHAHVLKGKAPVSDEYILLFLKGTNISPYINGAVQLKLNQKNMNSIPFLKASDSVLNSFSKAIAPLYSSLREISEQQTTLVTLRDTLLPKLLSGELSVIG